MKLKGQRRGAEVLEERSRSLQGGGRKSLRRGAEVLEEGDGNQTDQVWRSILYWAANKQ